MYSHVIPNLRKSLNRRRYTHFFQKDLRLILCVFIVFIDYTIPVRVLMLERYPQLCLPDGPFDLDTPLPPPPEEIDWTKLETHVVPVSTEHPVPNHKESGSRTSSPGADSGSASASLVVTLPSVSTPHSDPESPADATGLENDAYPTWHDVALSIAAELMRNIRQATFEKLGYTLSAVTSGYQLL